MIDIVLEKLNVSDDMYLLNELFVESGSLVKKDDTIFSIESSKITIEIQSPAEGYLYFVDGLEEGMELPVGFLIGKIVEKPVNPFETVEDNKEQISDIEVEEAIKEPKRLIVTSGARPLMEKAGLKVSDFSEYSFVCKNDIVEACEQKDLYNYGHKRSCKRVAIIGAGAGAVQVIDLIRSLKDYVPVIIFDDTAEKKGKNLDGVYIDGAVDFSRIKDLYTQKIFDCVINSVSTSIPFRRSCYEHLSTSDIPYCNLIHESCVIGSNVQMGTGNILFPFTHIGADTFIGNDNFITAKVSIEHHNHLGSHCTFGPGVMTSGHVTIGDETRFGTGIYIEPFVEIGKDCLIASGAVLTQIIPAHSIVRHNPGIEIVKKKIR